MNRFLLSLLGMLALLAGAVTAQAQAPPNIAAAANLRLALTEIAAAFERDTGDRVSLTFGSSGNFYRQLQQDAPFEMFLSADEETPLALAREGRTLDRGAVYAIGRLAIVAPKGSPLKVDGRLEGLKAALRQGRIARFAIANPEHAPYGARAEEALRHAGLWTAVRDKLVFGENVAQAVQFATAGGAQGGIVAYSLVRDPAVAARADHALIPAAWHKPLGQRMVLMKDAGPVARRFYAYMRQPAARRILARHGFALPGARG